MPRSARCIITQTQRFAPRALVEKTNLWCACRWNPPRPLQEEFYQNCLESAIVIGGDVCTAELPWPSQRAGRTSIVGRFLVAYPSTSLPMSAADCPICQEPICKAACGRCMHKFCYECLLTWCISHNGCPSCRQDLELSLIHI